MHGASFTQLSTSHTMDVLFNDLLAELPAILGRFYQDHKCLHKCGWLGVVGSPNSGGLNTRLEVTLPNGPNCVLDTTKSSQINDWPVVWRFTASWLFINSQQSQLKTIRALVDV